LASVTVDDVRDVINISSAEVPDTKILKMLKRAEVTLELELGKEINYQNCTDTEKDFITVLAAIRLCHSRFKSRPDLGQSCLCSSLRQRNQTVKPFNLHVEKF